MRRLIDIQYDRNDINLIRGTFRVRGDVIDIIPVSYGENAIRVEMFGDEVERILEIDTLTGEILGLRQHVSIFPASHYVTGKEKMDLALQNIESELQERLKDLRGRGRLLEAQRLEMRTNYDMEMMREVGFCSGIENYSRHLTGRAEGESPYTLLDYFPADFSPLLTSLTSLFRSWGGCMKEISPASRCLLSMASVYPQLWITVRCALPNLKKGSDKHLCFSHTGPLRIAKQPGCN